jgi:hypothetical protein
MPSGRNALLRGYRWLLFRVTALARSGSSAPQECGGGATRATDSDGFQPPPCNRPRDYRLNIRALAPFNRFQGVGNKTSRPVARRSAATAATRRIFRHSAKSGCRSHSTNDSNWFRPFATSGSTTAAAARRTIPRGCSKPACAISSEGRAFPKEEGLLRRGALPFSDRGPRQPIWTDSIDTEPPSIPSIGNDTDSSSRCAPMT